MESYKKQRETKEINENHFWGGASMSLAASRRCPPMSKSAIQKTYNVATIAVKTKRRSPKGGWQYLKYLAPPELKKSN